MEGEKALGTEEAVAETPTAGKSPLTEMFAGGIRVAFQVHKCQPSGYSQW